MTEILTLVKFIYEFALDLVEELFYFFYFGLSKVGKIYINFEKK